MKSCLNEGTDWHLTCFRLDFVFIHFVMWPKAKVLGTKFFFQRLAKYFTVQNKIDNG